MGPSDAPIRRYRVLNAADPMREESVALDDIIRHLAAIEQLRIDLVMQSGGGNQATAAGGDG